MTTEYLYPRYLLPRLLDALEDSPVTLIHGPRQCGKTTLAQLVAKDFGFSYVTFDDDVQRSAAQADPVGYVADLPQRTVLDEIQRVPQLFTSLKAAVDQHREPGRFILTGSANVLLLPQLADSLVGRMEILRLHPLAQTELESGASTFIPTLFASGFTAGAVGKRQGKGLAERVAAGGYPTAIAREKAQRRATWYRDYIDTLIQRDIRDLARITALHAVPRLLTLAAGQTARLVNISELAAPFQISRPTIRQYLTLLSQIFLVEELPAWHNNRLKRLVKTPKLHMGDTGLLCGLLGMNAHELWEDRGMFGQVLETFVYLELQRQSSWLEDKITFSHFRDKDQAKVDIVLETGRHVAGVEVKASSTVKSDDFAGLRKLQQASGKAFAAGVLLYDGDAIVGFGESLYAVPISTLWA